MILADHQIRALAHEQGMITPFIDAQVRRHARPDGDSYGVASYGLTSYGYDMRLAAAPGVWLLAPGLETLDPKRPTRTMYLPLPPVRKEGEVWIDVPAHACVLGCSLETFAMPADVCGVVLSKSTYARAFAVSLVTPLEPGWCGQVTIEIVNHAPRPVRLYLDEGICQVQFYRGAACERPYGDGKYQGQAGITLGRV